MLTHARFAYTQARLQSRHGLRLDEQTWRHLESHRELPAYLHAARNTALRPWVIGLNPQSLHHELESDITHKYRSYISEVAQWLPAAWHKSVLWVQTLCDLPALEFLLMGNTAPAWMTDDPHLKEYTVSNIQQRIMLLRQSRYAPLVNAWHNGQTLLGAWIESWQSLWPEQKSRHAKQLPRIINILQKHLTLFADTPPAQAWASRLALDKKLTVLFRNHTRQPLTAFTHLALVALDFERLRGGIITRSLFNMPQDGAA